MSTRDSLRRFGLGKIALAFWHQPVGRMRDSLRAGGPWQQRKTELGRSEMEQAAYRLPVLPSPEKASVPLELHLLTGRRFWYQTAFCLWTFGRHANRFVVPVIYDDGSLEEKHRQALQRIFPATRFLPHAEIVARLEDCLPEEKFPYIRERWRNYPNIRKLTDVHAGQSGWKLVIDSDLLFFRRPEVLTQWLDQPATPLHAVDVTTSYGYSRPLLDSLAGTQLADLVNVGLCGLNSAELDWEKIEFWCRSLHEREGTSYYLEQALVAMLLAGRQCTVAPANEYLTLPRLPEARDCRATMHHYVAESKRWYFQTNWRQVLATANDVAGKT